MRRGERLKPQRSPTRKKMVTCFPPFQPARRLRARCAADLQRMRTDAGVKPPGEAWLVLLKKGGNREKEKKNYAEPDDGRRSK